MSVLAFKIFGYTYWQIVAIGFVGMFFLKILRFAFYMNKIVERDKKIEEEDHAFRQKLYKELGWNEYGYPKDNLDQVDSSKTEVNNSDSNANAADKS